MTISTRYHFCLFSALQGIPFLAITRSDKVADLCADLDWVHCLAPEDADAAGLVRHAGALLNDPAEAMGRLAERVAAMKTRAAKNASALEALFVHRKSAYDWVHRAWSRVFNIA